MLIRWFEPHDFIFLFFRLQAHPTAVGGWVVFLFYSFTFTFFFSLLPTLFPLGRGPFRFARPPLSPPPCFIERRMLIRWFAPQCLPPPTMRENVDKSENNAEQAGIRKATHSPQQLGLIKKRIIQLNAKMILLKDRGANADCAKN